MWDKIYIIVSDLHCPFTDMNLYDKILDLAHDIDATDFIINGDGFDFYSLSKFEKNRKLDLQYELDEFETLMRDTRKRFKRNIYFIKGNHENRLEKFLATRAAELSSLKCLNLKELCGFNRYNITYVPKWLIIPPPFDGIVYHGSRCGANASKAELSMHLCNVICGHTHKSSFFQQNSFHGRISCWHFGTIADKTQIDESCKFSVYSYWNQSFGVLKINKEHFKLERIECDNNGFIYGEKAYQKVR